MFSRGAVCFPGDQFVFSRGAVVVFTGCSFGVCIVIFGHVEAFPVIRGVWFLFSWGAVCFSQSPFLCFHGGQFVFHGDQFVFSRGRVCFSRSPVCVFTGCSFGVHSGKSFCFHGGQFFVFTAASLCFRLLKPTGPIRHLPCACWGAKCDNTLHV